MQGKFSIKSVWKIERLEQIGEYFRTLEEECILLYRHYQQLSSLVIAFSLSCGIKNKNVPTF